MASKQILSLSELVSLNETVESNSWADETPFQLKKEDSNDKYGDTLSYSDFGDKVFNPEIIQITKHSGRYQEQQKRERGGTDKEISTTSLYNKPEIRANQYAKGTNSQKVNARNLMRTQFSLVGEISVLHTASCEKVNSVESGEMLIKGQEIQSPMKIEDAVHKNFMTTQLLEAPKTSVSRNHQSNGVFNPSFKKKRAPITPVHKVDISVTNITTPQTIHQSVNSSISSNPVTMNSTADNFMVINRDKNQSSLVEKQSKPTSQLPNYELMAKMTERLVGHKYQSNLLVNDYYAQKRGIISRTNGLNILGLKEKTIQPHPKFENFRLTGIFNS